MAQVINTNVASLNAQRNLNSSQSALQTSLTRLSSGLRINSAKDDAAGLAISDRFTAQIRGSNQAMRNANDGISFAQTAEGALGEIGNALQRMRELAVQSANDTNSASDRSAINNEVQQLIQEVNRIAGSTQFNGQNILDGNLADLVFQVGANAGQTITVSGVDARASKLGAAFGEGGAIKATSTALSDITINGQTITLSDKTTENLGEVIGAINAMTDKTGVSASRNTSVTATVEISDAATLGADTTFSINGQTISVTESTASAGVSVDDIANAINGANLGVKASVDSGKLTLSSNTDITVTNLTGEDTVFANSTDGTYVAGITLSGELGSSVSFGSTGAAALQALGLHDGTSAVAFTDKQLDTVNVTTRDGASNALEIIDAALQSVSGMRAELGAVQTRFESTISNLSTSTENLSAARSRIMDTDFAAETANLTRAQILQQAGTAMLAQANSLPQGVLSLLR